MYKSVLSIAFAAAMALGIASAYAEGKGGTPGKGASQFAPGHGAKNPGWEGGTPPGQVMKKKKSTKKTVKKSTKKKKR